MSQNSKAALQIIALPGAFAVVDTSVPGWRTVEQHGDRARAEAALARHREDVPAPTPAEQTPRTEEDVTPTPLPPGPDEAAEALYRSLLQGTVGQVLARIAERGGEDGELLAGLRAAEEAGAGRKTLIEAITRRMGGGG